MPQRWVIVVNPTKFDDVTTHQRRVRELCLDNGWAEPRWVETTADDPGLGQARAAVEDGADLVCSLGGDGTVRKVATALVGTGVPLGLLPGGTGNLLARNLRLPLDDLAAAVRIAVTGDDRPVDVGVARFDGGAEEVFLVMAGMGADAETMANADETLKGLVGWPAYLLSGARALFSRGFAVRVAAGQQRAISQQARAVLIGNCGELQGGLALMPEAKVDDGHLDTLLVAPRGFWGWGAVLVDIVTRHRRGHRMLRSFTSSRVKVKASRPVEAQLDGDAIGARQVLDCHVNEGALLVRVAQKA